MKSFKLLSFRIVAVMIWVLIGCDASYGAQPALAQQQLAQTDQPQVPADQQQSQGAKLEERQLRLLRLHLEDLQSNVRSINGRMKDGDYSGISEHAKEMYDLVRQMRLAAIDIPGYRGEIILRGLTDLQHATDELKDSGSKNKHKGSHHAMETIENSLKRLEKDL